jgi:hypothetical protein
MQNDLSNHHQFGYKKHHSCEALLLKFIDSLLVSMDQGKASIVILCDLSAAFDTVDHRKLLSILNKTFNVSGTALQWFESFLTGRSQRVIIRDAVSSPLALQFGVPQGSVLGPVLFNMYTHSLSDVFTACNFNSLSYADDTSGFFAFAIDTETSINDSVTNCMENVKLWMDQHFLKLNQDKTQIIVFGSPSIHRKLSIDHITFSSNTTISATTNIDLLHDVKYLGVLLDKNLSLKSQVNSVCSNCYYHLKRISSIRSYIGQKECESLIHAIITSRLDYSNVLYFVAPKCLIMKLQRVQNAAARLVLMKSKCGSITDCFSRLH